jgi:hypothetical protein
MESGNDHDEIFLKSGNLIVVDFVRGLSLFSRPLAARHIFQANCPVWIVYTQGNITSMIFT